MSETETVTALENLLAAMDVAADVTRGLIEGLAECNGRLAELAEDVAGLGLRVVGLEMRAQVGHSLRALPPVTAERLEQATTELREELAAEVQALTERIDHVHNRALKALTELTERNASR